MPASKCLAWHGDEDDPLPPAGLTNLSHLPRPHHGSDGCKDDEILMIPLVPMFQRIHVRMSGLPGLLATKFNLAWPSVQAIARKWRHPRISTAMIFNITYMDLLQADQNFWKYSRAQLHTIIALSLLQTFSKFKMYDYIFVCLFVLIL